MNVSVTFDNLGEASDLERGWWPEDEPIGAHYSVTEAVSYTHLTLPTICSV